MEYSDKLNFEFSIDIKKRPTIFDHVENGILITDDALNIFYVNPAFSKITGYSEKEVINKKSEILYSGFHEEVFYKKMWQKIAEQGFWEGEIWNRRKSGQVYPEFLTLTKVSLKQPKQQFYISIFSDISFLERDVEKKLHLAYYDPLTKLPNRLLYNNRAEFLLEQAMEQPHQPVAIYFIDLDKFKEVNDTYGHVIGDKLLQVVGKRLKAIARGCDTIARIGGDEFAAVTPNIKDVSSAMIFAQRIVDCIEKPFSINNITCHISVSIGISFFPTDGSNIDELMIKADRAMYNAKRDNNKIMCVQNNL